MEFILYTQRLDYIKELVEKGKLSSPSQLATSFNCSERTVRRMIENLRIMDCDIQYCKTNKKYFLNSLGTDI